MRPTYELRKDTESEHYILRVSPPPGLGFKPSELKMTEDQTRRFLEWASSRNNLIQNVFPELSAEDREIILTGINPEDWKKAFGED